MSENQMFEKGILHAFCMQCIWQMSLVYFPFWFTTRYTGICVGQFYYFTLNGLDPVTEFLHANSTLKLFRIWRNIIGRIYWHISDKILQKIGSDINDCLGELPAGPQHCRFSNGLLWKAPWWFPKNVSYVQKTLIGSPILTTCWVNFFMLQVFVTKGHFPTNPLCHTLCVSQTGSFEQWRRYCSCNTQGFGNHYMLSLPLDGTHGCWAGTCPLTASLLCSWCFLNLARSMQWKESVTALAFPRESYCRSIKLSSVCYTRGFVSIKHCHCSFRQMQDKV